MIERIHWASGKLAGIWRAKVPGKVKVHIWKACRDILPTISRLCSRRVFVANGCYFCNEELETIAHVCRDCPFVHDFLHSFSELGSLPSGVNPAASFLCWLASCSETLSITSFDFLLFALRSFWKERNQRVWQYKLLTKESLVFINYSFSVSSLDYYLFPSSTFVYASSLLCIAASTGRVIKM